MALQADKRKDRTGQECVCVCLCVCACVHECVCVRARTCVGMGRGGQAIRDGEEALKALIERSVLG